MKKFIFILFLFSTNFIFAQNKLDFDGQYSAISSFSPDNKLDWFLGGRYLPQLSYKIPLDSPNFIDFEVSANLSASNLFHPFDSSCFNSSINPYRFWARYSGKQYEIRLGLQKIDFGSASILRPLQWFNQIDPRDPLQLTNGVCGALGRYNFLNNANIWLWVLYGNEKTRGFDVIETNEKIPEAGARIQLPIKKGEIAFSYHHRTSKTNDLDFVPQFEKIPENKIGIDAKFDLKVGLWFEATHSFKSKNIKNFTYQTLINIGTDYTFGIGKGLNVIAEHLIVNFDEKAFDFKNPVNISALITRYPLGFFDNLSAIFYYSWEQEDFTFFLNYEHQFNKITGYVMAYVNPETQQGIQQNDLVNNFAGPGIRLMLVYNH